MKTILDLNKPIKDLDGNSIKDSNMGKFLAQMLVQSTKGESIKFWEMALSLHKGESFEIDTTDLETLTNFVKSNETVTILVKAQLLLELK